MSMRLYGPSQRTCLARSKSRMPKMTSGAGAGRGCCCRWASWCRRPSAACEGRWHRGAQQADARRLGRHRADLVDLRPALVSQLSGPEIGGRGGVMSDAQDLSADRTDREIDCSANSVRCWDHREYGGIMPPLRENSDPFGQGGAEASARELSASGTTALSPDCASVRPGRTPPRRTGRSRAFAGRAANAGQLRSRRMTQYWSRGTGLPLTRDETFATC